MTLTSQSEADGEVPSVRSVVRQYAPFVGRSLRYLGIGETDVEDAAQEVFVVVHRRLDDFEGRSSLQTWLYGICVRIAFAHRRKAAKRKERVVDDAPSPSIPPPQHADLQRKEARRRLQQILDELDEAKRSVFVLYEIERMPMKQVAETLGCPLQTAYSRHQAARKQVLAAFERHRRQEQP
ncbi:MAG: sigma-70 family RNA polymerase sigma factor [Deltaproteobacteria bacterium]|nr:sigma-70 family RNA polymerase sigma factor [Deltaproteobacteria bacterium]MBW2531801.1 sigma-70 family RNA polymerase sigma factor [Deltaproteobacteria bacterium]